MVTVFGKNGRNDLYGVDEISIVSVIVELFD